VAGLSRRRGVRGNSFLTTAILLPLTMTVPFRGGGGAPWRIGMELVPSTTAMSIETFSSFGEMAPKILQMKNLGDEAPLCAIVGPGMVTRWLIRAVN
jgi:hypothetical protein